jgi:hypothetical protein
MLDTFDKRVSATSLGDAAGLSRALGIRKKSARSSRIRLDFYAEGSLHADVVGGLETQQRPGGPRLNGGA